MASKKLRVHTLASGFRMRSRDNLIRLRDTKLRPIGIGDYRSLLAAPILLGMILLVGWLRMPVTAAKSYRPVDTAYARPMVGWALPAQTWGETLPIDVSLVYAEATWAELEPEKGQYAFEAFEEKKHLDEWWAAGKRLILRLVIDRPGAAGHKDIPDWLIEEIGSEELAGSYYETAEGSGYSPDYSNLMIREAHRRLIAALANRYNAHPGVAYVEMGSLGWDGEWTVNMEDDSVERLPVSTISREYSWH